MKRAIATITIYVHGNNDQELYDEAKKISDELNQKYDCVADIEQMHVAEFGGHHSDIKKMDLSKLKQ